MTTQRLDIFRIDAFKRTESGSLDVTGRLTRSGVLKYSDGNREWRELRSDAEVFQVDSLDTLRGAAFVVGHPGKITPENWSALAKGHVRDDVKQDGKFVTATIRVNDAATIKAVESGALSELSCGYTCTVRDADGEHCGEKFQSEQQNIRYNHVGVGGKGWGRAGSDVRIIADGASVGVSRADGELTEVNTNVGDDEDDAPNSDENPPVRKGKKNKKKSADTVTPDVAHDQVMSPQPPAAPNGATLKGNMEPATTKKDSVVEKNDALEAERDLLKSRCDALEAQVKELSDVSRFDSAVQARVATVVAATRILGSDFRADGKTEQAIQIEVIAKCDPKLKLDGKSPEYIRATYDLLVARADQSLDDQSRIDSILSGDPEVSEDRSDEARTNMLKDAQSAWKGH